MKRARWLLLVIVIAEVVALALGSGRGGDQPLTIAFVGITNVHQFDRPVAMFVATNRNARPLRYATHVERKTGATWPVYFGPPPHNASPFITVPAGREFTLFTTPPAGDVPWRISVAYGGGDVPLSGVIAGAGQHRCPYLWDVYRWWGDSGVSFFARATQGKEARRY